MNFLKQSFFLFTLAVFVKFGQSQILYITPLPSGSCSENPCLTISSFAVQNSWLVESNVTLVFLPGNHTLDTDASVSNVSILLMLPKSSYEGSQNPVIICQKNASFNFDYVEHLFMSNLKFIGCGINRLHSISQLLIEDSIFLGLNDSQTALEIVDTNASIFNCSFISNKVGSYRGPIGILEYWKQKIDVNISVYSYIGGAIIANQSNLVIIEGRFEGNSANVGGAIFAELASNITIINSTFVKNDATCSNAYDSVEICFGGVLHSESGLISDQAQLIVVDSEFSGNSALYGGVVSIYSGTVTFTASKFSNNSAGMYSDINQPCVWTLMNITDACFNKTKYYPALGSGGVLFLMYASSATVEKSQFYNNTAIKNGGTLHVSFQSVLTISSSEFWNNKALGGGGVIYLSDASKVDIANKSLFHNNIAAYIDGQGGVLAAFRQSSVTICDSEFWNNVGLYAGGAVYVHNVSVSIHRSHFHSNAGNYQGGVLNVFNSHPVTLSECEFHNNSVNRSGGVIIAMDSYTLTLNRNLFMNNKARNIYGGVLLAVKTKPIFIDDNDFIGNYAPYGGAITTFMSDFKFRGWNNKLSNNTAENGGAIYASESKLNVYNMMMITNNVANDSGGGTYLYRSELNCQDSSTLKLANNRAIGKGGGIHAINSLVTVLFNRSSRIKSSVDFTSNSATAGGGVYLETTAEIRVVKMGEYMTR